MAPPKTHSPPTVLPVSGKPTVSPPSSSTPTLTNNTGSSSSSSSSSSNTDTASSRIQQITSHLAQKLPSTLRYVMSTQEFKQAPHKLLVIPGPIEVSDDVLLANAHPSMSHVSPDFVPVFGDCLRMLRQVLYAPTAQPFITAGSGTLGWDMAAANAVQPGDEVLVLNSGYFGDSFAECLQTYGSKVTQIKAPIGAKPSLSEVEAALKSKKYKMLTFTHVDTSTGVLSDAKGLGELVKRVSPETILVLDGVCSVGSEEIRMDEWGIDIVLTASQKGLGVPPGLCIFAASKKAIAAYEARSVPPNSYFASWAKWLPVMRAYESGTGAYFATPPTNLVYALHQSLTTITTKSPNLEERFKQHLAASERVKRFVADLGLKQLVADPSKDGAHGMTAVCYPDGFGAADVLPKLVKKNVVMAAGLHKEVKDKYFRIGHMGVTVVNDKERGDLDHMLTSLKEALAESGYKGASA